MPVLTLGNPALEPASRMAMRFRGIGAEPAVKLATKAPKPVGVQNYVSSLASNPQGLGFNTSQTNSSGLGQIFPTGRS